MDAPLDSFEYDPFSYELDADPYPSYRRLRDEAPLYYNERLDFYALTRFDDCHQAFIDWQTFSSARGTVLELMDTLVGGPLIIFMDPPRQTRLRNLVSKVFTPRRIAALEPQIREIACGYLDPLVGAGACDFVKDFSAKLPMDVISALLGIPPSDRDQVRGWSNDVLHRDPGNPMPPPRALRAMGELFEYFAGCIEERRRRPRDDMMSDLTQAEVRDEDGSLHRLDDLEIKAFFNLLATAGNETVTKLLATAAYCLGQHPDQRKRLAEDTRGIPDAVIETLRYDPPSQYQGRTTTREVRLQHGILPEGAKVLLINAASGRDERQYADPDRFDVTRKTDFHLNFGHGRHVCLGKNLALMESRNFSRASRATKCRRAASSACTRATCAGSRDSRSATDPRPGYDASVSRSLPPSCCPWLAGIVPLQGGAVTFCSRGPRRGVGMCRGRGFGVMGKREVRAFMLCFLVGLSLAFAESATAATDLVPASKMGALSLMALGMAGLALHPGAGRERAKADR